MIMCVNVEGHKVDFVDYPLATAVVFCITQLRSCLVLLGKVWTLTYHIMQ